VSGELHDDDHVVQRVYSNGISSSTTLLVIRTILPVRPLDINTLPAWFLFCIKT